MVDCKERGVNAPLRLVGCPKGPNDTKQDIKGQGLNSYHWMRDKTRDSCPGNASHAIASYYWVHILLHHYLIS